MDFAALYRIYRHLLMDDIVPYWTRHAVDREYGGICNSIEDDGRRISGAKYMWSQGRAIWTFAAIHNRVTPRPDLLQVSRDTAEFVLRHARDEQGWWCFQMDQQGRHVQGPISIYSEMFAAYGLGELYRATGEPRYRDEALAAMRTGMARIDAPDFDAFAPYTRPEGVGLVHGVAMIGLETGQELLDIAPEPDIRAFVDRCARAILDHHVRWQDQVVLEFLSPTGEPIDSPAGRAMVPGHAIESMWFVLHWARRQGDLDLARRAVGVIRWCMEKGWDPDYGGLLLGIDTEGREPVYWKWHDTKLWWPATEALYALLLGYEMTGEPWCLDWYQKLHDWSFAHFPDAVNGEWVQRLTREGTILKAYVALPVKDPFHLPRAVILILDVLGRMQTR